MSERISFELSLGQTDTEIQNSLQPVTTLGLCLGCDLDGARHRHPNYSEHGGEIEMTSAVGRAPSQILSTASALPSEDLMLSDDSDEESEEIVVSPYKEETEKHEALGEDDNEKVNENESNAQQSEGLARESPPGKGSETAVCILALIFVRIGV
eukprot:s1152_g8.t1